MAFSVYKSSAGSGKTYALVKAYLKIVLSDKTSSRYKNILAITFTNKAASEMKARVIDALTAFSSSKQLEGTPYFLLKDLETELQLEGEYLRHKSALVLTSMLHNYSDIAISTIDKFVYKLVRSFAYDLDVPLNFSVEMDAESMLQVAIDLLISKVGSDEELTQALVAFAERKAEDEKSWNIEVDLNRFSADLLKEQNLVYLDKLKGLSLKDFFSIREVLEKLVQQFETDLRKIGEKGLKIIADNSIEHKDFAGGAATGIGKYFTYMAIGKTSSFEPTPSLLRYMAEDTWYASKASAQAINAINNCKEQLKTLFNQSQAIVDAEYKDYILLNGMQRNIYALSLLNEIEKVIAEIKKENNQLHISEFSKKISQVVMNEPVPFIYERIGEKYKNYLIDEFQDTSVLQWQNFIPLIENSLATNDFNMLVGDAKQAIYRWRGGEVEQFTYLPKIYQSETSLLVKEREKILQDNFIEAILNQNRRSKKEIVTFNNSFFRYTVDENKFAELLKPIYASLEQEFDPLNSGGYVSFHILNKETESYQVDKATCDQLLLTINNVLADNYDLSDIAILTRNNRHAVIVSKFLIESGIDVVSKESLLLNTSSSVNFILNCINYLNDAQNATYKVALLEYLLKSNNSPTTISHSIDQEGYFKNYLVQHYPNWNRERLLKLPLYELCEEISRIFNLNSSADPYLVYFFDAVYNYSIKNSNELNGFLLWWERKKKSLSIVIPHGLNAINVMTIHKSKGLEFPIVLFPYANWTEKKNNENIWVNLKSEKLPTLGAALLPFSAGLEKTIYAEAYHQEQSKKGLDDLNILYVAFTRAINRLYVFCEPPDQWKKIANYYIDFFKHQGLWKENQQLVTIGEPIKKQASNNKIRQGEIRCIDKIVSNDWRGKISLSEQSNKMWNLESTNSDKDYGNLIHTALSRIGTLNDIKSSIQSLLDEGLIAPMEVNFLTQKLQRLINRAEVLPFFETGLQVKMEAELILLNGKIQRPDRIIFYPEKAVVLDYKTGVELEKHKAQLHNYAVTLSQMGYLAVEKYLLYTESEKLVRA